jgi:hypothetical protein
MVHQTEAGIVWIDRLTGYDFYTIASDAGLYYTRTIDGGATWAAGVQIQTSADQASRISNFGVWFDRWTPQDAGTLIHLAWLDAVSDQLHYVNLDYTIPALGTEVNAQSLAAFTLNVSHGTQGVTITKSQGGNLYIAMRSGTSLPNANRFMRSVDGGLNWTTRAISHTPASVGTVRGLIFPGYETDDQDIYALNLTTTTSAEIWVYDDSADTWSIGHTITTDNVFATGICQCAVAIDNTSGFTWVGVRDNLSGLTGTFYVSLIIPANEIIPNTSYQDMAPVFEDDVDRGEGIALMYDSLNDELIASAVIINAGEHNPTKRVSDDDGLTWGTETFIDTADNMQNPRTQPGFAAQASSRWTPVYTSTDGGSSSLEIETGFTEEIIPVFDPVIVDDDLADKIGNMLDGAGLGGDSGGLLFSFATFIFLAFLLFMVKAPAFVALPMLALWGGGLAITGFLPTWIPYVALLVGGVGIVLYFTRAEGNDE